MSRVGRQPIPVPAGVKVAIANGKITVEGKVGGKKDVKLELAYHPNMKVEFDAAAKEIKVIRPDDERQSRALHGLTRSLINNLVVGVTKGFETKLKIEGLGYQARMDGKTIVLSVGYANQIKLTPDPTKDVAVAVTDKEGTVIVVSGSDKQAVGQLAAEIRAARPPEPYKGKGIRYDDEVVRRKEGKTFASGG
jgi:large subunit ribosomal protein L6